MANAPNALNTFVLGGNVGKPTPVPDGGFTVGRFGREGDLIASNLQPWSYEQTKRGNAFTLHLAATSTGIAAGQVVGAAAALSVQFAVWNPSSSGKDMVLTKFFAGFISGTLPVAPINHSIFNASAVSVTPSGTIKNNYGNTGQGSAMRDWVSAGGAAFLGAGAATTLRGSAINFTAGTVAQLATANTMELIDGDIIIPPGYGWMPTWASAAALLNWYAVTWIEVPA